ncbi:hypothetical protein HYC85_029377 [Camellia sinensis]|uniref:Aminotransferase-like plant mobile domain-containing protein n=1 Tax=Camellia sinensis TaxID=4442 RepID=A0A7J7G1V9_CAMSI|nr:hypothetical protein HYC85_029377 [Camellia sinensis]
MEQRDAVTSSGLGGLLNLRCTKLDHDLCEWLVQKFDPKTCSLNVHGRRLLLTELDVHKLLGIPAEGKTIELKKSSQAFPKLFEELGVVQGPIKLNALREYLTKTEGAGEEFMRIFALYILGAFLCPTTKDVVKQSFIHLIQNVDGMKDYNWSKFTLQFFVRGLCKYNSKSHSQPNGCLFLIMLFYFDCVAPSGCDAGRARSIPSLAYWGDAEIKATLKLFQKSGGYQNEEVILSVDVNFVVDEQMQPFVQSEEMKNMNDIRISKIETTVCDMKSVLEELVVIVKSGITNSSIPKVMEKCEPLQMSKQQEAGHGHCKCEPGIVAPGVVVESTVVPLVEHVSPILVPKPNVVVESTVVPTVEHENNTLPPKPNVVVALQNMEENRIPLTPSNLQLDAHLHEQTKQAKNKIKGPYFVPAEPLLEGQTQDLVDKFVLVVLLVHKVVNLGLVALAVQVAVEGKPSNPPGVNSNKGLVYPLVPGMASNMGFVTILMPVSCIWPDPPTCVASLLSTEAFWPAIGLEMGSYQD